MANQQDPSSPANVNSKGWAPVPDPTLLTTQQLIREVTGLREVIETRLEGMDKAIELLQKTTDKFPCLVRDQVDRLQELHTEKFRSIEIQFKERDTRTEQTSKDSKVAVDAALQAAKEAVGEQNKSSSLAISKSETATTKQIDLLGNTIQANTKTTDDKFNDYKDRLSPIQDRLTTIEGQRLGQVDTRGVVFSVIAVIGSVIGMAIGIMALFLKSNH